MSLTKAGKLKIGKRVRKVKDIMWQYDDPMLVRDLLADVLHYCESKGICFGDELDSGREHFCAERNGEDWRAVRARGINKC